MKTVPLCSFVLLSVSGLLQAQFNVPQLGPARYSNGSIHLIRGIGANLIVDSAITANAEHASFSDTSGLLSVSGLIRLLRIDGSTLAEYHSDEPSPLLHSDSTLQTTAVWLPSKHLLLRWDGGQLVETSVDDSAFGGKVTFVSLPSSSSAQFYVTRVDSSVAHISVALPSGRVTSVDTLPAAHGWVFVQQGWILSQDEWGLIAERPNGLRQTIQLSQQPLAAGDLSIEPMSNHWLHVSSRSVASSWALYVDTNKVNIFLLPPPALEAHR
jgi:hypothetical protein